MIYNIKINLSVNERAVDKNGCPENKPKKHFSITKNGIVIINGTSEEAQNIVKKYYTSLKAVPEPYYMGGCFWKTTYRVGQITSEDVFTPLANPFLNMDFVFAQ